MPNAKPHGVAEPRLKVLKDVYGFDPGKHLTLYEVASIFGMSTNSTLRRLLRKDNTPNPPHAYGKAGVGYFYKRTDINRLRRESNYWMSMANPMSKIRQMFDNRSGSHKSKTLRPRIVAAQEKVNQTLPPVDSIMIDPLAIQEETNYSFLNGVVKKRIGLYRTLLTEGATPDEAVQMIKIGLFD